jgi:hypothetical protein
MNFHYALYYQTVMCQYELCIRTVICEVQYMFVHVSASVLFIYSILNRLV